MGIWFKKDTQREKEPQKFTPVERQIPANLPAPQSLFLTIFERLMVTGETPKDFALSGDKKALIGALEQIIETLKVSEEPEVIPQIEEKQ